MADGRHHRANHDITQDGTCAQPHLRVNTHERVALPSSWPASELRVLAHQTRELDRYLARVKPLDAAAARWAEALDEAHEYVPLDFKAPEPREPHRCLGCGRCRFRHKSTGAQRPRARRALLTFRPEVR